MLHQMRAVLFDACGALFLYPKTERWAQLALQARACGLKITDASMVRACGQITSEVSQRKLYDGNFLREAEGHTKVFYLWYYRRLLELLELSTLQDRFGELAQRMFEQYVLIPGWKLDPQAIPLLKALQRSGLGIGVVSNGPKQVHQVLVEYKLSGFMRTVVVSDEFGDEKPHAPIFHQALSDLGLAAGDCIYVGDVPAADIQGALNAGMLGVLIDRTNKYPDPAMFCIRIHELKELFGILGL